MRDGICSSSSATRPWLAGHALQGTLQGPIAERMQSSSPREELHDLKRALMGGASELHQSSSSSTRVGHGPSRGGDRDSIPNAISKLDPEMLYLAEEDDWARQGEEVRLAGGHAC